MKVRIKNQNELIEADWTIEDDIMVVSPKVVFEPREGDVITCTNSTCSYTLILGKVKSDIVYSYAVLLDNGCLKTGDWSSYKNPRHATEEEKQKLFDKLAENGFEWDADKKQIVKLKWKPKFGEVYYTPSFNESEFEPHVYGWVEDKTDLILYGMGWVFDTKVKCQEFCDRLNKAIRNIKP